MSAHYNVMAAVESIHAYLGHTPDDIILNVLPLSFDYGLYQIFLGFFAASTVVLEKAFPYPYRVLEILKREGITGFPIVPTIAALLTQMNLENKTCGLTLRYITSTGDAFSTALAAKLQGLFPEDGRLFHVWPHRMQTGDLSAARPDRSTTRFSGHPYSQYTGIRRRFKG